MTKNLPRKPPTAEKIAPTWTATQLTMALDGDSAAGGSALADSAGRTAERSRADDPIAAPMDKAACLACDIQSSAREVADEIDVLAFLTSVLNGSVADAQLKDRFKAAELLGAHYGLFDKGASGSAGAAPVAVIDDIAREVSG